MAYNNGIAFAGNILTDIVKTIDCYPKLGMLANISAVSQAVGGSVPNTSINLAKIDGTIPLSAVGKVGNDANGKYVIDMLNKYGINTDCVSTTDKAPTSFTDVMTIPGGDRTFFHSRGANALFDIDDVDVSKLSCDIFHIGYILLLDKLDAEDKEYGTVMARLLKKVQDAGIKTSVDVASDSNADYAKMIKPALKYCDFLIFNEVECCAIWGLEATDESGYPIESNIRTAMQLTLDEGVREKVIVHCKRMGYCLSKDGTFAKITSLDVPRSEMKGSVGAGDSFCAASLYGIYKGMSDQEIIEFASAAAACNLFAENSIDGMLPYEEILKVAEKYGRE